MLVSSLFVRLCLLISLLLALLCRPRSCLHFAYLSAALPINHAAGVRIRASGTHRRTCAYVWVLPVYMPCVSERPDVASNRAIKGT
ncbi:hypothetical protein V8C26DRAFT_387224 [Trichoderma gracile]